MMIIVNFLGAMIGIRVYALVLRIPVMLYSGKDLFHATPHNITGVAYQCEKSLHPI